MDKIDVITNLNSLIEKWNLQNLSSDYYNQCQLDMESLLEAYLKAFPQDVDMWVRLAMILKTIPLDDIEKAIECLKTAYKIDPHNSKALASMAYLQYIRIGSIEEEIATLLKSHMSVDSQQQSMIEYMLALYYINRYPKNDQARYMQHLEKSVLLNQNYVHNLIDLARVKMNEQNYDAAKKLLNTAINNVKKTFGGEIINERYIHHHTYLDISNIDEFINEFITGTKIDTSRLEKIKAWRDSL